MQSVNIESSWDISKHLLKENKLKVLSAVLIGLALMFVVPQIGILIIILPFFYYFIEAHGKFMSYFASANNMTYTKTGNLEDFSGRLFEKGMEGEISNVVAGAWNSFPIKIFNFSYEIRGGKNRQPRYFTVLEISFEKVKFPFILLKSKKMWSIWLSSGGESAEIPLYNQKFKLSATKGYEIETLQIFSERLLAYLADKAPHFSIEFSNNKINIFGEGLIGSKNKLITLLDT